jgi:hypothetical protein
MMLVLTCSQSGRGGRLCAILALCLKALELEMEVQVTGFRRRGGRRIYFFREDRGRGRGNPAIEGCCKKTVAR